MKKLIIILLAIVMSFSVFAFAGCGKKPTDTDDNPPIVDDGGDDFEDDDSVIDTTNFDTPEAGFVIDGKIDEAEKAKYNTLGQKYGVEGQLFLSYYIGTKGIYYHMNVADPIVYKANKSENEEASNAYVMDSDRIELFLDTKNDKGSAPKVDDYHILVTLEGKFIVRVGNGSTFKPDGSIGIDQVAAVVTEGTTVTERNKNATSIPQSSKNVDAGYSVEFFMSYKNFDFAKTDTYGMSVAQTDIWHVTDAARFNVAGSNLNPAEFRTLSQYGLGTSVELEQGIKIDAKQDAYYTTANAETDPNLTHFTATRKWGQVKGNMTTNTYVYTGKNGLYIYMNAESEYLRYYYADFPYFSDNVEIRIDTNNNKATDPTVEGDRFFFMDILGAGQTAYGIDNDSRVLGSYDLIATTAYTGELVDAQGKPVRNSGSTDAKTFTFEAFFPWTSINVAAGQKFAMMLACGNPNEGSSGIGNVFYDDADYSVTDHWFTFIKFASYTEFTRPA